MSGFETWALRKEDERKLEVQQIKFLRPLVVPEEETVHIIKQLGSSWENQDCEGY
jgi:hypothetical protein